MKALWNWLALLLLFRQVSSGSSGSETHYADGDINSLSQDPISSSNSPIILVSTLEGTLTALNSNSGQVLWSLDDHPAVLSPYDASKPMAPTFLPDPIDGSIYMIGGGGAGGKLKKLPFTIPELVAASPCKSSDGILYTGKKVDSWFAINKKTGKKVGGISPAGCSVKNDLSSCPNVQNMDVFLIGRTEYNIIMLDARLQTEMKQWNISFYDYSVNMLHGQKDSMNIDYDLAHFTDSATGNLIAFNKKTGSLKWESNMKSPVIGMYRLHGEGLLNIPFTSVSEETLSNLIDQFSTDQSPDSMISETKLYPTLYVGEYVHGLYAMPSLVDQESLMIDHLSNEHLLLEGPNSENVHTNKEKKKSNKKQELSSNAMVFGHHKIPSYYKMKIGSYSKRLGLTHVLNDPTNNVDSKKYPSYFDQSSEDSLYQPMTFSWLFSMKFLYYLGYGFLPASKEFIVNVENKELKIIVLLLGFAVTIFARFLQKNVLFLESYFGGSIFSTSSVGSNVSSSSNYTAVSPTIDLGDGNIRVGNIQFNQFEVLGKGCEGTFVYKGSFDNRLVAVKRVLSACFSIADREVDLLRESDDHENVIRYFCMEQDRQFRYIALEYCIGNLQDFVEGRINHASLQSLELLKQTTRGLNHLHSLDIVHRDIKPHNILIAGPNHLGEFRALISDFGLCKKLKMGRMSFSRRSGITGTEGWIAPEIMTGNSSTTVAVDIFSLGCAFYYVLSGGSHPFGENFRCQANILAGDYDLSKLDKESDIVSIRLIEKMLHTEIHERPSTSAILKYPLFWTNEKILNFLQDVSDRVDKEQNGSFILAMLERRRSEVVKGDWIKNVDSVIQEDLKKHRSYKGTSVRDLLRALRNKKHHFQDLEPIVKLIFGSVPNEYTEYWVKRFPMLLIHVWFAMHPVKTETVFVKYYDKQYDFIEKLILAPDYNKTDYSPKHLEKLNTFEPSFDKTSSVKSNWEKIVVDSNKNEEETEANHHCDSDSDKGSPEVCDEPSTIIPTGPSQIEEVEPVKKITKPRKRRKKPKPVQIPES